MNKTEMLEILRGKVLQESPEKIQARLNEIADELEQSEKVVHGHWEEIQLCRIYNEDIVYSIGYKCNQCGRVESKKEPYCHCGAKMQEVSE